MSFPNMFRIRQIFDAPREADVETAMDREQGLMGIGSQLDPR